MSETRADVRPAAQGRASHNYNGYIKCCGPTVPFWPPQTKPLTCERETSAGCSCVVEFVRYAQPVSIMMAWPDGPPHMVVVVCGVCGLGEVLFLFSWCEITIFLIVCGCQIGRRSVNCQLDRFSNVVESECVVWFFVGQCLWIVRVYLWQLLKFIGRLLSVIYCVHYWFVFIACYT